MPWSIVFYTSSCVLMCYLYYVAHTVVVHNCSHNSMFRSKRMNTLVGHFLCRMQLMDFEGWRVAHMLHHRFSNTPKDPHYIDRPMIRYLLTHYIRIALLVSNPVGLAKTVTPLLLAAAAVITWQALVGHGARGGIWVAAFWAIPVLFSQIMVAHFNYITHVGLSPGRGKDTRNLTHGVWPLINWMTFNLYLHREHHLHPRHAIPQLSGSTTKRHLAATQAASDGPAILKMPQHEIPVHQSASDRKAA
jgi:fatty acid desaturase